MFARTNRRFVLGRRRIVVYSTTLERWQARKGLESSNLSVSAKQGVSCKALDDYVFREYEGI